ncbi:unnamed protein product [Meganyctiphanes norvegica]|uniref:DUF3719 domain-containing protein n=1 Tax=Meganyctiphanes norvegica TaxID=48144 RepID=A0AAV2QDJ4_MEGNR
MTQEEDDLEEELRRLDIREDHGAEDSDATPTNTPPTPPPALYVQKYPQSRTDAIYDQPFRKYSGISAIFGDYDSSRSDSSLSWGEDEFEGEATRQVTALFDQLDTLLYQDEKPLHPGVFCHELSRKKNNKKKPGYKWDLDEDVLEQQNRLNANNERNVCENGDESNLLFVKKTDNGKSGVDVEEQPSASDELVQECNTWVKHFPHFRCRGHHLEPDLLLMLEGKEWGESSEGQFRDRSAIEEEDKEEIICKDGDFYDLLPMVSLQSIVAEKKPSTSSKSGGGSSGGQSRVCSGSSDPEVLKEQVLIMLFDKIWLNKVAPTLNPLLHQYAKYVIEQSVQYSSLSREPSTRGSRHGVLSRRPSANEGSRMENLEGSRNTKNSMSTAMGNTRPVSSLINTREVSANSRGLGFSRRPLSGLSRPSSAANRLPRNSQWEALQRQELHEILQVSTKPLLLQASAMAGNLTPLSLPSVANTPRASVANQRPVSSRSTNHLLAPMRIDSLEINRDQRPSSTSSNQTRNRFQEKFLHLAKQGTIQELGDVAEDGRIDGCITPDLPTPTWSRHLTFLPPIGGDSTTESIKLNGTSLTPSAGYSSMASRRKRSASIERSSFSTLQEYSPSETGARIPTTHSAAAAMPLSLSIKGSPLSSPPIASASAASNQPLQSPQDKTNKHLGPPIIETRGIRKLTRPVLP